MSLETRRLRGVTPTTESNQSQSTLITHVARCSYAVVLLLLLHYHQLIQICINTAWEALRVSPLFTSVYFETIWAILCYFPVMMTVFTLDKLRFMDRYKIYRDSNWTRVGIRTIVLQIVEYGIPLVTLDTFMVKKYRGVNASEWDLRRQSWVQYTRALPPHPPTVLQISYQLTVSLVLYDLFFGIIHYMLHKNRVLYRYIHADHHNHSYNMTGTVTNQLHVVERIILVLSANEALKLVGGHPLTRMMFVPVFEWWLTDNHSGYDCPWSLDKVVPLGIVSGSRRHWVHHIYGAKNYAPFFAYFDEIVVPWYEKMRERKIKLP